MLPGLKRSPIEKRVFTGSDGLYLSFVPSQYLKPDFACWYQAKDRVLCGHGSTDEKHVREARTYMKNDQYGKLILIFFLILGEFQEVLS